MLTLSLFRDCLCTAMELTTTAPGFSKASATTVYTTFKSATALCPLTSTPTLRSTPSMKKTRIGTTCNKLSLLYFGLFCTIVCLSGSQRKPWLSRTERSSFSAPMKRLFDGRSRFRPRSSTPEDTPSCQECTTFTSTL
jgi:hypothetical protein